MDLPRVCVIVFVHGHMLYQNNDWGEWALQQLELQLTND